jgi:hypothetical protein
VYGSGPSSKEEVSESKKEPLSKKDQSRTNTEALQNSIPPYVTCMHEYKLNQSIPYILAERPFPFPVHSNKSLAIEPAVPSNSTIEFSNSSETQILKEERDVNNSYDSSSLKSPNTSPTGIKTMANSCNGSSHLPHVKDQSIHLVDKDQSNLLQSAKSIVNGVSPKQPATIQSTVTTKLSKPSLKQDRPVVPSLRPDVQEFVPMGYSKQEAGIETPHWNIGASEFVPSVVTNYPVTGTYKKSTLNVLNFPSNFLNHFRRTGPRSFSGSIL